MKVIKYFLTLHVLLALRKISHQTTYLHKQQCKKPKLPIRNAVPVHLIT